MTPDFEPGELVKIIAPSIAVGLGEIIEQISPLAYRVQLLNSTLLYGQIHTLFKNELRKLNDNDPSF